MKYPFIVSANELYGHVKDDNDWERLIDDQVRILPSYRWQAEDLILDGVHLLTTDDNVPVFTSAVNTGLTLREWCDDKK